MLGDLDNVYRLRSFATPTSNMHKVEIFHSYAHAARFPFVVVGMALAFLSFPMDYHFARDCLCGESLWSLGMLVLLRNLSASRLLVSRVDK